MLTLRLVKAGVPLVLPFNPCGTPILIRREEYLEKADHPCSQPIQGASMPTLLRLRVDVYNHGGSRVVQRVRSEEFRLAADAKSP